MSCFVARCSEPRREKGIYCVNHSCKYGRCYDENILQFSSEYEFCRRHTCADESCRNRKWTASRGNYCRQHSCKKRHCFERNHIHDAGSGNPFCILHIVEGERLMIRDIGVLATQRLRAEGRCPRSSSPPSPTTGVL
jgi:hypothetical protein